MMPIPTDIKQTETFYIDSKGFLYLKFFSDKYYHVITSEVLNSYIDNITKIKNHNISSILVDLRNVNGIVSLDKVSFRLLAKDIRLRSVCEKIAFVTQSPVLTFKINNYITKYRPHYLIKVYNDINDGIDFCKN